MALAIDYNTLRREVGRYLAYGRDPDAWSTDATQDVADIIANGLRRVYWPLLSTPDPANTTERPRPPKQTTYIWSFLTPNKSLTLTVSQATYDLPDDFTEFASDGFTYAPSAKQAKIARVSDATIESLEAQVPRSGAPQYFAIRAKNVATGVPTRYEVHFYPSPDVAYTLSYNYSITPATLSDDNPYPLGGAQHSELMLEACLAEADKTLNDDAGLHEQRFRDLLQASILRDQAISVPTETPVWPFENEATGLSVNKAYLKRLVGDLLGYGPSPANWDHTQTQRVKLALETGLRKFYSPAILPGERYGHEWAFLRPTGRLSLVSGQHTYDLPDDFSMFEGDIIYAPGQAVVYPPITLIAERQISLRLQRTVAASRPTLAAYRPKVLDQAFGTRYEVLFWPVPNDAYDLSYNYSVNPGMLTDEVSLPFGGQPNMQTIIEACLCAAEELLGKPGLHCQLFQECLATSVGHDRKVNAPDSLGLNIDRSDRQHDGVGRSWHDCQENIVTYNGIAY